MSGTCYFPPTSLFVLFHHRLPSLKLSRSGRKKTLKNLFFIKPKKLRLCKAAAPKYLPVYVLTSARQAHHPSAHPTTPSAIDQPIPYRTSQMRPIDSPSPAQPLQRKTRPIVLKFPHLLRPNCRRQRKGLLVNTLFIKMRILTSQSKDVSESNPEMRI